MLIHSVYFWFKPDADPVLITEFEDGLKRLAAIPQLKRLLYGRPEETPPRPVIDRTYDWALVEEFEDLAAHDAYQEHPLHAEFVNRFKESWQQVRVYDVKI